MGLSKISPLAGHRALFCCCCFPVLQDGIMIVLVESGTTLIDKDRCSGSRLYQRLLCVLTCVAKFVPADFDTKILHYALHLFRWPTAMEIPGFSCRMRGAVFFM
ncbi:hypothetical protein CEXT_227581 [Caerostris extrusa]|uniref:Secreted protein n=1 Tax=Caerostris extrusa TaxID=172846 RepID=A0AAV4QTN8_CAEEX|nr:hypothetical protein CEXT_227581 [Caerostris extrusa]